MSVPSVSYDKVNRVTESFSALAIDDQLALLWFIYREMGNSVTPAAPGAASPEIAAGLFEQVKEKPQQEQLSAMQEIASGANTQISREYGSLSANTKLAFWYFLAQGMDEKTIISMPEDYQFAEQGKQLLKTICEMDFEAQITFLRDSAMKMGAEPTSEEII